MQAQNLALHGFAAGRINKGGALQSTLLNLLYVADGRISPDKGFINSILAACAGVGWGY